MGKYKLQDVVMIHDESTIRSVTPTVSAMTLKRFIDPACLRAGKQGIVVGFDLSYPSICEVKFPATGRTWIDENWIVPPVQKPSVNVGSALKAQRKLNEEQDFKLEYKCNCTFNDLMGLGHRCGRLAPIDKGYKKK